MESAEPLIRKPRESKEPLIRKALRNAKKEHHRAKTRISDAKKNNRSNEKKITVTSATATANTTTSKNENENKNTTVKNLKTAVSPPKKLSVKARKSKPRSAEAKNFKTIKNVKIIITNKKITTITATKTVKTAKLERPRGSTIRIVDPDELADFIDDNNSKNADCSSSSSSDTSDCDSNTSSSSSSSSSDNDLTDDESTETDGTLNVDVNSHSQSDSYDHEAMKNAPIVNDIAARYRLKHGGQLQRRALPADQATREELARRLAYHRFRYEKAERKGRPLSEEDFDAKTKEYHQASVDEVARLVERAKTPPVFSIPGKATRKWTLLRRKEPHRAHACLERSTLREVMSLKEWEIAEAKGTGEWHWMGKKERQKYSRVRW